jgi:hypothetical protein
MPSSPSSVTVSGTSPAGTPDPFGPRKRGQSAAREEARTSGRTATLARERRRAAFLAMMFSIGGFLNFIDRDPAT